MRVLTHNMFGKNEWYNDHQIIKKLTVACLQECGDYPPSYDFVKPLREDLQYLTSGGKSAVYLRWTTDDDGKIHDNFRCSMCIVSNYRITRSHYLNPLKNAAFRRPVIGATIKVGGEEVIIFNMHAPASSQAIDYIGEMLPRMKKIAESEGVSKWICGGDFNCDPEKVEGLFDAKDERVIRPDRATQIYSNLKDYFLVSGMAADALFEGPQSGDRKDDGKPKMEEERDTVTMVAKHASIFDEKMKSGGSDHMPIILQVTRTPAPSRARATKRAAKAERPRSRSRYSDPERGATRAGTSYRPD